MDKQSFNPIHSQFNSYQQKQNFLIKILAKITNASSLFSSFNNKLSKQEQHIIIGYIDRLIEIQLKKIFQQTSYVFSSDKLFRFLEVQKNISKQLEDVALQQQSQNRNKNLVKEIMFSKSIKLGSIGIQKQRNKNLKIQVKDHLQNIHIFFASNGFQNLNTLILDGKNLNNIQFIGYLKTNKLRSILISYNLITNIGSLAKCKFQTFSAIDFSNNPLKQHKYSRINFKKYSENINSMPMNNTFKHFQPLVGTSPILEDISSLLIKHQSQFMETIVINKEERKINQNKIKDKIRQKFRARNNVQKIKCVQL